MRICHGVTLFFTSLGSLLAAPPWAVVVPPISHCMLLDAPSWLYRWSPAHPFDSGPLENGQPCGTAIDTWNLGLLQWNWTNFESFYVLLKGLLKSVLLDPLLPWEPMVYTLSPYEHSLECLWCQILGYSMTVQGINSQCKGKKKLQQLVTQCGGAGRTGQVKVF